MTSVRTQKPYNAKDVKWKCATCLDLSDELLWGADYVKYKFLALVLYKMWGLCDG